MGTSGCTVDTSRRDKARIALPHAELEQARMINLTRHVAQNFLREPQVVGEPNDSGVAVSQLLFEKSDTVVVSDHEIHHQLRAASIAVVAHAPMLLMDDTDRDAVQAEIGRLGARYILAIGDVGLPKTTGNVKVIPDSGSLTALGKLTSLQFRTQRIDASNALSGVSRLDGTHPTWLLTNRQEKVQSSPSDGEVSAFPVQSRRDAGAAPQVIATQESGIAAVATARSYGASVTVMRFPDPRLNVESMRAVAGLSDQPLIALGSQFGTSQQLSERIELGERAPLALPNKTGLVFALRTLRARYLNDSDVSERADIPYGANYVRTIAHPLSSQNQQHWKAWADAINAQDGFVFIEIDAAHRDADEILDSVEEIVSQSSVGVILRNAAQVCERSPQSRQKIADRLMHWNSEVINHNGDQRGVVLEGLDVLRGRVCGISPQELMGLGLAILPARGEHLDGDATVNSQLYRDDWFVAERESFQPTGTLRSPRLGLIIRN